MARDGAARRIEQADADTAAPLREVRVHAHDQARGRATAELDRVIHERMRLAIVSALAGADSLSFNELKDLLDTTDGNLSVHARRLEEAGFIACEKGFVERVPRTSYRLTAEGRAALDAYLDHMESLIRRVREG